ncbi:unnamed protein product [Gongylonema pulchrum]|uniref:60S ribosomal protein L41 n=1 Tax=Gongylonema pulchrum TaxID=637853 RepID=A0A183E6U8_9BILA|nr:unnamed protein product [Gongylonema pulchrum]
MVVLFLEWRMLDGVPVRTPSTRKPLGRLDMIECAVLEQDEYMKRVATGQCPPQPTKRAKNYHKKLGKLTSGKYDWRMKKRKEGVRKDWTRKKRLLLKAVFLGKQAFYRLQLRSVNYEFELIQGLFLVLECPKRKKEKKVMCFPVIHCSSFRILREFNFAGASLQINCT